jgi:hypothetical protein
VLFIAAFVTLTGSSSQRRRIFYIALVEGA